MKALIPKPIALAVQSAGGQRMTQTGVSLGTPQYTSPEQAKDEGGRVQLSTGGGTEPVWSRAEGGEAGGRTHLSQGHSMSRTILLLALSLLAWPRASHADPSPAEVARWQAAASRVTIIRDTWGIPHIYAKTDADVVFGAIFAQAEDDFHRVERNYVNAMGRLAEVLGEQALYRDLRMKLFIDPAEMKRQYARSPEFMKRLMTSWADGLNYYLYAHPTVKPELITRFEPWMALTFSEGSIGGDIENVDLAQLAAMYGAGGTTQKESDSEADDARRHKQMSGSNGIAIAPSNTSAGHALLLINPHTSFYFRAELQMVSEEGLNAYGASTWGQFFIYQGFNERLGWMHTSTAADAIDEYAERIVRKPDGVYYRYGATTRKMRRRVIALPYKAADGDTKVRSVSVYYSHHGPIVRQANGHWIAIKLMNDPARALMQSYGRMKATNYAAFSKVMELRTNTSNNTMYADADGTIAYWHGNFVPRRSTAFDFNNPVDGSNPATEWQGLHPLTETIKIVNPKIGWIQNTNSTVFTASGQDSPRKDRYPVYMAPSPENYRGIHAVRVLKDRRDFTLDKLIGAAFDPQLPAFDAILPPLIGDYDALAPADPRKAALAEPIDSLRRWPRTWGATSVPMTLADNWGREAVMAAAPVASKKGIDALEYLAQGATPDERLSALTRAVSGLTSTFGTWRMPWGETNRFQRINNKIESEFDDSKPSVAVPFGESFEWGSLAAYYFEGGTQTTKKRYGNSGNTFVAVVEFGPRVKAKAVSAGGQSGDPLSPHFADQIERYITGNLRDVWFYRAEVEAHAEKTYRPGGR